MTIFSADLPDLIAFKFVQRCPAWEMTNIQFKKYSYIYSVYRFLVYSTTNSVTQYYTASNDTMTIHNTEYWLVVCAAV